MISIHAAREGGDGTRKPRRNAADGFQSTPPVKAATSRVFFCSAGLSISIHAAREGGDGIIWTTTKQEDTFQSTPPVKAATRNTGRERIPRGFQSTPPVKAATAGTTGAGVTCSDFNPRRP